MMRSALCVEYLLLMLLGVCLYSTTFGLESCSSEGSSRIVTTPNILDNAGRVEVCHNGAWGTVATTGTLWSEKNAQVACRSAGFSGALNSIFPNGLAQDDRASGNTPVHYFVTCDGSEGSLSQCQLDNSTISSFLISPGIYNHFFDAFVVCRPRDDDYSSVHVAGVQAGDIRLHGNPENGQGALEIYTRQFEWVSVCIQGFDDSDASVLCSRLGYATGRVSIYDVPPSSTGSVVLYDTQCSVSGAPGLSTSRIVAGVCTFLFAPTLACPSGSSQYAGVECIQSNIPEQGAIRLFGDSGSSGMLEVFYDGKWGMVCRGDSFGDVEAMTACGELGFHPPKSSLFSTAPDNFLSLESNLKPIWLSDVDCGDSSPSISQCTQSQIVGYAPCSSLVAITCEPLLSAAEIVGIVIGITAGLILIFIIIWFSGLNKVWANRNSNPKYRAFIAGCTSCGTKCQGGITRQREAIRTRREASRSRRQVQAEAQISQPADQALREELHIAEQNLQPSAPRELSEKPPPEYAPGVGFEPLANDLPPPYVA